MIKYAIIIDEEKGLCNVALGADVDYYITNGYTELDVLQSDIDNNWYLANKCPMKTDEEKANERKTQFLNQFFKIDGYGYYRKQPKGYGSAVESLNTAFNIVSIKQKLPTNTLTFYLEPDFTNPEQCTEDWLVANAIKNEEMSAADFGVFYAQFMTDWNTQEHKQKIDECLNG